MKRFQLLKQKLIPSKRKDHLNDGNPKLVWDFHVNSSDGSRVCHVKKYKNTLIKTLREIYAINSCIIIDEKY